MPSRGFEELNGMHRDKGINVKYNCAPRTSLPVTRHLAIPRASQLHHRDRGSFHIPALPTDFARSSHLTSQAPKVNLALLALLGALPMTLPAHLNLSTNFRLASFALRSLVRFLRPQNRVRGRNVASRADTVAES